MQIIRFIRHRTPIAFYIRYRVQRDRRQQIILRPLCRVQEAYINSRKAHVPYATQLTLLHTAFSELDKLTGGRD